MRRLLICVVSVLVLGIPSVAFAFDLYVVPESPTWMRGHPLVLDVDVASTCVPAGTSGGIIGECSPIYVVLHYWHPDSDVQWIVKSTPLDVGRIGFTVPETDGFLYYFFTAAQVHCVYDRPNILPPGSKHCDSASVATQTYSVMAS